MKADVLKLIRNTKEFIPLDTISQATEMSPQAVKISIKQLMEAGYDIECDKDKGYHLNSYPENITSTELLSRNPSVWAGKTIVYRQECGSTNEEAKLLAEDGRDHGCLVVTEKQLNGKGRRGRSWADTDKDGIAMSLLLRPKLTPDKASMITLVAALAVADVLAKLTDLEVKIKWPNDIVINKKKVCGILTEMAASGGTIDNVIVGVGINVNQKMFDEEISHIATSLYMEKGERYSRADIIIAFLEFFEYYYDIFEERQDFSDLVNVYESYLINKDVEVRVLDPAGEYTGTACGINDFGELIVQKEDGKYTRVSSGEVSVRGVYGYV